MSCSEPHYHYHEGSGQYWRCTQETEHPRGWHYLVPGSETLRRGKPFCACGELWPCPDADEENP